MAIKATELASRDSGDEYNGTTPLMMSVAVSDLQAVGTLGNLWSERRNRARSVVSKIVSIN